MYFITADANDAIIYSYSKLQTDPTNVKWIDGSSTITLNDQPTLLFIAPDVPLSAEIEARLGPDKGTQFLGPAKAPDGKRLFDLYRLPAK